MNAEQAVAEIKAVKDQNEKALGEIRGKFKEHLEKIAALEEAVRNAELPASVTTALTELKTSSQALDDVVPDAPVP